MSKFMLGCNYWSSKSAIFMWSDWDEDIIEKDFKLLSENGITTLRVFPLWSEFQPISLHRGQAGRDIEYMFGELPLPNGSGVSEVMMERFKKFVEIADKYKIDLIVALITGWMSSRLFVPPALEGKNHLTDSESIMWQIRFVKYFVSHFKAERTIIAWDLGNECNVLGTVKTKYEAYLWSASITNAIKSEDTTRNVISGMHGLTSDTAFGGFWSIQTQGEICDILTTHPYPLFTEFCDVAGLDSMRSVLHSTAESCYYSDIAHKPCLVEEIGTLGPMIAGRAVTAKFARAAMFSALSHGHAGFLWWCSFDFDKIVNNPYNWVALERELGLFDSNGTAKPIVNEFSDFDRFLKKSLPGELPRRDIDAVCILTPDTDQWPIAYGTFVLAKKAGLDITFQFTNEKLEQAQNYIIPSLSGLMGPTTKLLDELKEKILNGSDLFISYNDGFLSSFEDLTGLEIQSRKNTPVSDKVFYNNTEYIMQTKTKLFVDVTTAQIISIDHTSNVVFSKNRYGKGNVYFLAYPIELNCLKKAEEETEYSFYKVLSRNPDKMVVFDNPMIGITEHFINESKKIIVAINYSNEDVSCKLNIKKPFNISKLIYGDIDCIRKHDAAVFEISI